MGTDVRDPRNPKPVNFASIHRNSWCRHLQTAENLLFCIEELDLKALLSIKEYYSGSNQVASSRPSGWSRCEKGPAPASTVPHLPVSVSGVFHAWFGSLVDLERALA